MTERRFDASLARPDRLGAEPDAGGTNFALFSDHAEKVELCLFDADGAETRMALPDMEGGVWFGYVPGIEAGQRYGYRVHGPYAPEAGHRFNPNKLLIDPYARQLDGDVAWTDALLGYKPGEGDLSFDDRDTAQHVPKGIVTDPTYDWDADRALSTPWAETVIYEAHPRGLTMKHPGVVKADRGTFRALASDPVIEHLLKLGVTAIELLPVHAYLQDGHLLEKGLSNYWGYNTLNFFAPEKRYLATGELKEMQDAVRRFHKAGIEVILDVVYNHTCEGSELGPTLSFRGIDNLSYYLNAPDDPRHCYDVTGTGNTLDVGHPMVLRMVLDSLRHWVEVVRVDGFRFDLASTLAREGDGFEREGTFFGAIRQDPVLRSVKLIAEPWDVGEGGYQVGGFPWPFREWNDKFRDDVRSFWRRDEGTKGALAERLSGSPVQFDHSNRPATSSVNFISAHDGFTLWDTVSYDDKHNEANGEDGRDGHDNNLSDNMGVEGETDDENVIAARKRRARAMLATLILSRGVPMILAGDENGNSQGGNNNVYCQDNEIGWTDWETGREDLAETVATLTRLRRDHPAFRPTRFASAPAVSWLRSDGTAMSDENWADEAAVFAMRLEQEGEVALIVINGGDDDKMTLPEGEWSVIFSTEDGTATIENGVLSIGWQSVAVLTC
ncbi:glycogen debranching enzyme GlgX [Palleronia sediminis]|uniref:Glycogen debranching enzyme GlgX n=1 Tax=Palleronia sediminis TaxID=2547833 RepID=A0A4R6A3P8_9RHOB|nr:glycogen debranching protein GlgX [Palleronia sediminis]TDL78210.1 glycogen debranching enzyme GlgX [Palleronia sediminis]